MVLWVLVKVGMTFQVRVMMYKAVVQTLLLYGSGIWFITDIMMKLLDSFHHSISRRIAGKTTRSIGEEGF